LSRRNRRVGQERLYSGRVRNRGRAVFGDGVRDHGDRARVLRGPGAGDGRLGQRASDHDRPSADPGLQPGAVQERGVRQDLRAVQLPGRSLRRRQDLQGLLEHRQFQAAGRRRRQPANRQLRL